MLKIIRTEQEYDLALERAYHLMQMEHVLGSTESEELDLITLLIEHYEKEHYPILPPSPLEAIKFRVEQMGKNKSDLAEILGARSRQSEILSGKRKLSLQMIRKLHQVLQIPAESLIAEY